MDGANRISITVCGDGGCGMIAHLACAAQRRAIDKKMENNITCAAQANHQSHSGWSEVNGHTKDSYSVTRTIDGTPYHLSLTDTAGQEEYRGLFATSNLSSDAFLLVYDITSASSLATLSHFTNMIEMEEEAREERGYRGEGGYDGREKGVKAVKVVVGNKVDLRGMREVSAREGLEWARARGCGFMETSAREMVNIEETFALIVRRVVEARRLKAEGGQRGQQAHSTSRTQPLAPVDEKRGGLGSVDLVDRPGGKTKRGGFWARLRCW